MLSHLLWALDVCNPIWGTEIHKNKHPVVSKHISCKEMQGQGGQKASIIALCNDLQYVPTGFTYTMR